MSKQHRCRIYATRESCNEHAFAVKFIDAGDFPDNGPVHDVVNDGNFAIVAATDQFGKSWSYINLSGDEKDCVGERMEEFKCYRDVWYWCELFLNPE